MNLINDLNENGIFEELLKIKINKAFSKDILSKEEIEILQKNLFDYCTKVNWNLSKIEELAKELDLTVNIIKKLALRHAKEQFSPEEYNLFYKQVTKTIKDTTKQPKDSILNYRQKLEVINPILLEKLNKSTYWLWESLAEKEIVLKDIYDYCKMNNWNSNKLEEYANRLSITTTKLKELAKEYAKKILSPEEFEQLKTKINETTEFIKSIKLSIENPILLEKLNKSTYWLWENSEEKEIVLEYIYQSCENLKVNNSNINQLASRLHISTQTIDKLYKDYVLNYLKWTETQYFQKKQEYMTINKKESKSESKKIYDALLKATTIEEIKIIIEDSKLQLETIRFRILTYTNTYHSCNPKITEILNEKIKMYINYVSQQKKEQNSEKYLAIIALFVNDKECNTIELFCKKNNISRSSFIKYTTIAAETNPELYAKYSKKIVLTNNHKSSIVKEIRTLIMYLKTGIEEHGIIRPFDIIDYYSTTKILLKYILEVVEPIITKDDYNLLKAFVEQNTDDSMDNNVNKIMPNDTTPINETLINFLTQNKIPLNQKTYYTAYNRYINGTLDLNLSAKSK